MTDEVNSKSRLKRLTIQRGDAPDTSIGVGDRVRSYDFPDRTDCYIEGVVKAVGPVDRFPGCDRYTIWCEISGIDGKSREVAGNYVYPPVNGTIKIPAGVCNGVVKLPTKG